MSPGGCWLPATVTTVRQGWFRSDRAPLPYAGGLALLALTLSLGSVGCRGRQGSAGQGEARAVVYQLQIKGNEAEAGFDQPVTLTATLAPVDPAREWAFSWKQIWGPAVRSPRQAGNTFSYRTPSPPSRIIAGQGAVGLVALSAAQAGRQVFLVQATSPGRRVERTVEVFPAFPTASWPRMAAGAAYYLTLPAQTSAGESGGAWQIKQGRLRLSPGPAPYLMKARGAAVEWYTLDDPRGDEHRIRGGVWLGSEDCGRTDCHPREYRGWQRTKHATIFQRGVSGQLSRVRGEYSSVCFACHTLGYQVGAENDGFDDRVREKRWELPARLHPRNWDELPAEVRQRANVQCESCHGVGWFYTGYGQDICAQCHDLPPRYLKVEQAKKNRMHLAQQSIAGFTDERYVCRECHLGSEYLYSFRRHRSTSKPVEELDMAQRGITCPICHDPHGTDCPRQLRLCGYVEVPGRTFDVGQGALCISCHNGETDVVHGRSLRPFAPGQKDKSTVGHGREASAYIKTVDAAPHAAQLQLLTGRGGKFLELPQRFGPGELYPHMFVPDACVGCHYSRAERNTPRRGHTFKMLDQPDLAPPSRCTPRLDWSRLVTSTQTQSCAPCHGQLTTLNRKGKGDYDGNGLVQGIVQEIGGLLGALQREIRQGIVRAGYQGRDGEPGAGVAIVDEKMVLTDEACRPLTTRKGGHLFFSGQEQLLQKAAYNYLLVLRDRSGGIHNPQYVIKLLQNSILALERARGVVPRHPWKTL